MKKTLVSMMAAVAVVGAANAAHAQLPTTPFSVELRGGLAFPTGDLKDGDDLDNGVALSVNGQYQVNPMFSVYAEYDWSQFGITDTSEDLTDQGFGAGVIANFNAGSIQPFLRAGVAVNQLSAAGEDAQDEQVGFRVGGGLNFPLGNRLSVTPGVLYTAYGIKDSDFDVTHLTVDVGLKLRI
jgi:opacity protein-like surface antigen